MDIFYVIVIRRVNDVDQILGGIAKI